MSDAIVSLDGELIEESRARLSISERGFLYGDGLFETMRAEGGAIHLLDRHLRRLRDGARTLEIDLPSDEALRDRLRATLEANRSDRSIVRLSASRGAGIGLATTPERSTVLITLRPLLQSGDTSRDIHLITLTLPHRPPETPTRIKTLSHLGFVLAAREVARRGADEGALLAEGGIVAEGSVSNIFIVEGGCVRTAPVSLGVLPGIARGRTLEIARALGLQVSESAFDASEMVRADECFYTNAARGVVPVGVVDEVRLGGGDGIARRLRDAYLSEIADEEL